MSLDDKTPAEAARVKFPFKNWLDVIESQRVTIKPTGKIDFLPSQPYNHAQGGIK